MIKPPHEAIRPLRRLVHAASVALVPLIACSMGCRRSSSSDLRADHETTSSSAPSAPHAASSSAVDDACAAFAEHRCAALEQCGEQIFALLEGNGAACRRAELQVCRDELAPAGSNATAETIATCDARANTDCATAFYSEPFACVVPGRAPDGAPCAFNAECAGRYCRRVGAACGLCSRLPALGEECADGILCDAGLVCKAHRCVRPPAVGESCDRDCAPPYVCAKGKCVRPASADEHCDVLGVKAPDCDPLGGIECFDGTCSRPIIVGVGESCGGVRRCKGRSFCDDGVCVPEGEDGLPCDAQRSCARPLRCIDGTCVRLSRARCVKE